MHLVSSAEEPSNTTESGRQQAQKLADTRSGFTWVRTLAPIALLLALCLWEAVATLSSNNSAPTPEDWQKVVTFLKSRRQPGDLVIAVPSWMDPLLRQTGELVSQEDATRMDEEAYAVIWQVRWQADPLPLRGTIAEDTAVGPFRLTKLVRDPVHVTAKLLNEINKMTVDGKPAQTPKVSLEEVGFTPRRCLMLIAQPGAEVSLTFAEVALGNTLVGYVGLADVFTRRDNRESAEFAVSVNDGPAIELEVGVDDGWRRFELATTPGTGRVVVRVKSPNTKAKDRRVCFAAEARQ